MPRAAYTTSKRLRARAALLPLMTLGLAGCPAHIDARRAIVERVQFHGVQQVDEAALRERLAVRETSYFPSNRPGWLRWWRWWWQDPEYFDEASLTRDRLRVERFYQARGFYDARVAVPRQIRYLRTLPRRADGRIDYGLLGRYANAGVGPPGARAEAIFSEVDHTSLPI